MTIIYNNYILYNFLYPIINLHKLNKISLKLIMGGGS